MISILWYSIRNLFAGLSPSFALLFLSLGTKSIKAANVAATYVLAGFDRTLADAEALLKERPVVATLTDAQIKRMAESYYASVLAADEEERQVEAGSEPSRST
jgi:hypothetical protein